MKWRKDIFPKEGAERITTGFLFLPLTLCGETRWLEVASIVERFYHNKPSGGGWGSAPQWYYERWAQDA